ncbi:MAG: hypothetical protein ABEN55_12530, partial [Bradymonadaceae bacterium]
MDGRGMDQSTGRSRTWGWLWMVVLLAVSVPTEGRAQTGDTGGYSLATHIRGSGAAEADIRDAVDEVAQEHEFEGIAPSAVRAALRIEFGGVDQKLSNEQLEKLRNDLNVDAVVLVSASAVAGSSSGTGEVGDE